MKAPLVLLLALLTVPAFSGQAARAAVSTSDANPPVYQADGEGRNSMFETDVEKIQLGNNNGASMVDDSQQPARAGQQPEGRQQPQQAQQARQPLGQPAKSGWQPMGQPSGQSSGQSASQSSGQSLGQPAAQPSGQSSGQSGAQRVFQSAQPQAHVQAGSGAPVVMPNIPLGTMEESNTGLTLGTSLPKGSTWQLNSYPSPQGEHPHQVYKLSPSAALTAYFDPARRRAIKISIEVVHVPALYGAQAKATFENEVLMAVLFAGNLFVEMESNHALAKAMEDRLSLRNVSLVEGKTIDFGLTEMPIVYSARLEGGRYLLDIMGK